MYLLAKSSTHARALSVQFRDHTLRKTYLAIVRGGRQTFPDVARGSINAPLRIAGGKVVVDERDGSPTLTDWELLGSSVSPTLQPVNLLPIYLTGYRTFVSPAPLPSFWSQTSAANSSSQSPARCAAVSLSRCGVLDVTLQHQSSETLCTHQKLRQR